jgi:hypothetical protein
MSIGDDSRFLNPLFAARRNSAAVLPGLEPNRQFEERARQLKPVFIEGFYCPPFLVLNQ